MKYAPYFVAGGLLVLIAAVAAAVAATDKDAPPAKTTYMKPDAVKSAGSVRTGLSAISYDAVAGTLVVHPKDWDDAAGEFKPDDKDKDKDDAKKNPTAKAAMFYVAYFRRGAAASARPIMFVFNGGPGSSTISCIWAPSGPSALSRWTTAIRRRLPTSW